MSEKHIFIIIKYPKADTAFQALASLRELMQQGVIGLEDGIAVTKTGEGEIQLHRSPDDLANEGFLNGSLIGIFFADLFGFADWDIDGALAGTALAMLEQGIKDILLDEFGERMTSSDSAVAFLVEHVDWWNAGEEMRIHSFQGVTVISRKVVGELAKVENQLEAEEASTVGPDKIELPAPKGLKYIEGIGDVFSEKLNEAGIKDVEQLLEKGSTPGGREEMAEATGISGKLLLRWINMADLYRIKGIGQEYAELLEAAGVDTVPELAQRVPANLLEKMAATNAERKLVRRLPDSSQVESWVSQAKSLPRVITY